MIVGLDWTVVGILLPPEADRDAVFWLLRQWELGMVAGAAERLKDKT